MYVVNTPEFFLSHRLPIALAAKKKGYQVHVVSAEGSVVDVIREHGFKSHIVPFSRSGQNPLKELMTLVKIINLFSCIKPDLVHLVTIKPVLYGGMAARWTGVTAVVSAISGLGTVFLADSLVTKLRRWVVTRLYSAAFKQNRMAVIFQNPIDRDSLLALGCLQCSEACMIRGSGVDLAECPMVPESEGVPVVVMAARLLKGKGVLEFVDSARLLKQRNVVVTMRLIGSLDPGNPTSIAQEDIDRWKQENVIDILGYRKDVPAQYSSANIVCLPSYYGEGLPKSLVEAAACGRAVVTTDHPGCRDAITPNVTGLLVPIKDPVALADAIQRLIENPDLRRQMGKAGRALAEEYFAIEKIVEQHLDIYQELLNRD